MKPPRSILDPAFRYVPSGKISMEQALLNADSETDFRLRSRLSKPVTAMPWLESEPLVVAEDSRR